MSKMKLGKIISFEGLDKSGKHSAMDFVAECLEKEGKSVYKMSFPQYHTEIGKLIRAYLTGQLQLTPLAFEALQSADKLNAKESIEDLLKKVDFILIDRYIDSQIVYGMQTKEISWTEKILEDMPYPDVVFYMDVSVENSMNRKGEHGDNDKYESDATLLNKVHTNYETVLGDKYRMMLSDIIRIDANRLISEIQNELKEKARDLIK